MTCPSCGRDYPIGDWPFCPHGKVHKMPAAVHAKERAVVWRHPGTGKVRYPGRNDTPMPERYAAQGYERVEFDSAFSLARFEKQNNVANEALHCNSGNALDADIQASPAATVRELPVSPGNDASLTVNGTSITLRSANA